MKSLFLKKLGLRVARKEDNYSNLNRKYKLLMILITSPTILKIPSPRKPKPLQILYTT